MKSKKAFSLIELSIVILVIGIVIAGITQSSRLVAAFRLSSARSLTANAPVSSVKDLVMWVEATSEDSFLEVEVEDNHALSIWYDINPSSTKKNNPFQATELSRPVYKTECINSLPCINFAGANYFNFDGNIVVGTDYTIFIVDQRRSGADGNYFMGGEDYSAVNQNLILGYRANTLVTVAQYGNDFDATIPAYDSLFPRIHAITFSSSSGRTYFINGGVATLSDSPFSGVYHVPTDLLVSYTNAHIGVALINVAGLFYTGDIAEIIIFNRAITAEERNDITNYLGKKWHISVS